MNFQDYKRWICCLLVVILFGLGMCIEIEDADSYLAYETRSVTEESKYENKSSFIYADYCTNEILQRNNTQLIKNIGKSHGVRNLHSYSFILDDWRYQQRLKYLEEYFLKAVGSDTFTQAVIVEYIHRQDGEK